MANGTTAALRDCYSVTCTSDFPSIGYQPGEKEVTIVRILCTMITVSIVSSWCNKERVDRYLLFFTHWISGMLHQLAQMVLAEMVSLCWAKSNVLRFIQAVKFVELVGGNMLAITNLAICVNLALVVSSHRTMSRVKRTTSPRLMFGFLAIAVTSALAGAFFWETVVISGTLLWSINMNENKHDWVLSSIFYTELFTGGVMLIVVALLVMFRWPELCQAWQVHRRIKYYMALSVIATTVNLAIGVGGVIYVVHEQYMSDLIAATWTMRHVHIALDTLVLYSALGVTASREERNRGVGRSKGASAGKGVSPRRDVTSEVEVPAGGRPASQPPIWLLPGRRWGSSRISATSISPAICSEDSA